MASFSALPNLASAAPCSTTAIYDVHTDYLETPRLLTNSSGATVWTARDKAFGKAHTATDPDGDSTHVTFPLRFPGQYEDAETGLHYNRHRCYDPQIGRYLTVDPLGLADGTHRYQYAQGGPLRAAAGRTNPVINIVGSSLAIGGDVSIGSNCDCE